MIWVTWRQSRTEMFIFAATIAAVALFLIWTGLDIRSHYDSLGIANCLSSDETSRSCQDALGSFSNRVEGVRSLANWLVLFPFLAGALVAAPIVIDLEQGMYRLAWTQGVTRTRWLATKIGLGVAILITVSLIMMVLWRWWGKPFVSFGERIGANQWDSTIFDYRAVLVSYAIFAFALCLVVGTIFRRSIAAFGIALVGFIGIRVLILSKFRPHYLAPRKYIANSMDRLPASIEKSAWHIDSFPSDNLGHSLAWNSPAVQQCFSIGGNLKQAVGSIPSPADVNTAVAAQNQCFIDHNIYMTTVYQPGSRYWIFQGIESAIFLGMAAILLGITFYWVTRRIAR
jgi:hypothetical protein